MADSHTPITISRAHRSATAVIAQYIQDLASSAVPASAPTA
jgi:hypothetical protein